MAGGTTMRALWICRDPWPGKTERVPFQLAEPPEGLGECTERCPCAVFVLCQGRLRSEWSSPTVLHWLCVELSLKCEQTLRESPFFEAEVIGIVCVYLPLSSRSGTEVVDQSSARRRRWPTGAWRNRAQKEDSVPGFAGTGE